MDQKLFILNAINQKDGWAPIKHLLALIESYFNTKTIVLPNKPTSKLRKLINRNSFSKRNGHDGRPHALAIVVTLSDMGEVIEFVKKNPVDKVAVWVIDSFWTEWIDNVDYKNYIDKIFITSGHDIGEYKNKCKVDVEVLSWGTDALLANNRDPIEKEIDLLRVGRQPKLWDCDKENLLFFEGHNFEYHGRPPGKKDEMSGYRDLKNAYYNRAKFVLAHTNMVDSSNYTHPKKEYITARWTDALAYGCVVIGEQPLSDYAFENLLWEGATINIGHSESKLSYVKELAKWSNEQSIVNRIKSLEVLDWRWRIQAIADYFNLESQMLKQDLNDIALKASRLEKELLA